MISRWCSIPLCLVLMGPAHGEDLLRRRAKKSLRAGDPNQESPAREALAQDFLRRQGRPAIPYFAWAILSSNQRFDLALEEATDHEVDRIVENLWAQSTAPSSEPLSAVRARAVRDALEFLSPGRAAASPLRAPTEALIARATARPRRGPAIDAGEDSIDDRLGLLAQALARVLERTLLARDAGDGAAVNEGLANALRIIVEAYLVAGANAGIRAELFHTSSNLGLFGGVAAIFLSVHLGHAEYLTSTLNYLGSASAAGLATASVVLGLAEVGREYDLKKTPRLRPTFVTRMNQRKLYRLALAHFWSRVWIDLDQPSAQPAEAEIAARVRTLLVSLAGQPDLAPFCARRLEEP